VQIKNAKLTTVARGKVDWGSGRLGVFDGDLVAGPRRGAAASTADASAATAGAAAENPTPKGREDSLVILAHAGCVFHRDELADLAYVVLHQHPRLKSHKNLV